MSPRSSGEDSLTVLLSGSLAFDHIMLFPGYFEDHILPDKLHVLNVSFLVDSLDRFRGGVSGNIAYNLALLGQSCKIVAPVGNDFDAYRQTLEDGGVDTSALWVIADELTASAFITTDRADNQITGFYPGAMGRAGEMSVAGHLDGVSMAVVSPTAPDAMERHIRELTDTGTPYMFDPGQQIVALPAETLRAGIAGAQVLVGNDYEFAMIAEKTGIDPDVLVTACPVTAVTLGELGSTIRSKGQTYEIPSAPARTVVDPTGAGDAYRAGLLTGILHGWSLDASGRLGSVAAAYAVEAKGTQEHAYTIQEFMARFQDTFPDFVDDVVKLQGAN
jgi:adenosine kinase